MHTPACEGAGGGVSIFAIRTLASRYFWTSLLKRRCALNLLLATILKTASYTINIHACG